MRRDNVAGQHGQFSRAFSRPEVTMTTLDAASADRQEGRLALPNSSFDVIFDDLPRLGFCSVEGIEAALETPGPSPSAAGIGAAKRKERPATLVFRRAATGGRELWDWYAAARQGRVVRHDGQVIIRDAAGQPVLRITLRNPQPSRWRLGRLDALQPGILIEELELTVETLNVTPA
jgi:phage tail-like protein